MSLPRSRLEERFRAALVLVADLPVSDVDWPRCYAHPLSIEMVQTGTGDDESP